MIKTIQNVLFVYSYEILFWSKSLSEFFFHLSNNTLIAIICMIYGITEIIKIYTNIIPVQFFLLFFYGTRHDHLNFIWYYYISSVIDPFTVRKVTRSNGVCFNLFRQYFKVYKNNLLNDYKIQNFHLFKVEYCCGNRATGAVRLTLLPSIELSFLYSQFCPFESCLRASVAFFFVFF